MTIYYGLNVGKAMKDISDPEVALANLGLRSDNLDIIRQLSEYISRDEFHQLSGLVNDQKKFLDGFSRAGEEASFQAGNMPKIDQTQVYNYSINDRLVAGTIKYNYTDFNGDDGNGNPAWVSKGADISTSRVSSWSPFGPADNPDQIISYGSEIVNNGEFLALTSLGITTKPERRRFASETATTKIRLNINGEPVDVLAMKGIPFKIRLNVAQPNFRVLVKYPALQDSQGIRIPVTVVRADPDTGEEILGVNDGAILSRSPSSTIYNSITGETNAQASFSGNLTELTQPETEDYKIYYNPDRITGLKLYNQGISEWPNLVMENMTEIHSRDNPFEYMPDFRKLTPRLKYLYMYRNNMFLSANYAGEGIINSHNGSTYDGTLRHNIDRLPSSLRYLDLSYSVKGNASDVNFQRFSELDTVVFRNDNRARVTYGLCLPKMADASTRCNFDPSDSNVFNPNTGIITSTQKNDGHGFQDNDVVRYECKVGPISNPVDEKDITGVLGTAISPLVDGTNYKVEYLSFSTFRLKNTDGTAITYSGSVGTGTLHVVSKWDDVNDKIYLAPDFGVTNYTNSSVSVYGRGSSENSDGRYIPNSILYSTNLEKFEISVMANGFGNCDYRYYDVNNITKSNVDRSIKFHTPKLRHYHSSLTSWGIPDFSSTNNPGFEDTLEEIYISQPGYSGTVGTTAGPTANIQSGRINQGTDQRALTATKFSGLNDLKKLRIYSVGTFYSRSEYPCDDDANSLIRNKPSLSQFDYGNNYTNPLSFDDDVFTNTTLLKYISYYSPSSRYGIKKAVTSLSYAADLGNSVGFPELVPEHNFIGNKHEDCLGIRGPAGSNRTGLAFVPIEDRLESINYRDYWGLAAFQETGQPGGAREIKLSDLSKLMYFTFQTDIRGKVPSPSGAGNLRRYSVKSLQSVGAFFSWKQGHIIDNRFTDDLEGTMNGTDYYNMRYYNIDTTVDYQLIKDTGWNHTDVNSDFCPEMDSDSRTSAARTNSEGEYLPRADDVYEYQYMSVNDIIAGDVYIIMDPGNTTEQQWKDLGVGGGYGSNSPLNPSAQAGVQFQASMDAPNRFDTRYVHQNNIDIGDEVRLTRVGSSTASALQNVSDQSPSTVYGSTFNITRKVGTYNNSATILEKTRSDQNRVDYGTGKVAWLRPSNCGYSRGGAEFDTGTSDITGIGNLQKLEIENTNMTGSFPTLVQDLLVNQSNKKLLEFYVRNNYFTGTVPDFTSIERVTKIRIDGNKFSSHTRNTWDTITNCTQLWAYDNELNAAAAITIIQDLYDLWVSVGGENASRAAMDINLQSQNPGPGIARCSLAALINDHEAGGRQEDSAYNKYLTLIKYWTIKLDTDLYAS
jgi:hypothetical protein